MSANPDVVKKPYIKTKMTLEERQEIITCTHDHMHFITKYMKIQHPTKGVLAFEPYPFQYKMFDAFAKNRFNIVLTARQMGKCVIGFTKITKNGIDVMIGGLINKSLKVTVVDALENLLVVLSKK